jgi:tetratricopeptide (TPR) repeat protein
MCAHIKSSLFMNPSFVMNQFKYLIITVSLLLAACAQAPVKQEAVNPVNPHEPQDETALALPNVELTDDLLYEFLLTEVASQRGQTALAAKSSLDLAKKSRDPRLARRAAQLAVESGQMDAAIAALKFWQELEPDSTMAMRMLASVLVHGGKLEEARQEIIKVLKLEDAHAGLVFVQLYKMLSTYPDAAAALKLMRELAQPYSRVAEAHWAVAQLAEASGDAKLALDEIRLARSLRPEWDMAVSLEALLLQRTAPQQGLAVLRDYLKDYPNAVDVRLQYARALLDQKQYNQARDEFQRLSDEDPDNPDLAFAVALISMQMNDLQRAETQFKQALSKGKKDQDAVQYYLGQLSEAKNNDVEAIAYYGKVKGGEYLFSAQVRVAYLMSKRGELAEALQQLHQVQADNVQQRVQLILVEAQILREANRLTESYQLLQQGLAKLPENPDLLYGTAMMADKIGKPDVFEQLMRKLIQVKPDYAHAYNALGYSLLERNERIPEAVTLVEKALQLAPDDAAIMDSVGWGYYRSGKLDDSVKMLRRALTANPDPEIAAHLGEVLWARGDKGEAQKVWQDSIKANPGNAVLQAVMKKFMP